MKKILLPIVLIAVFAGLACTKSNSSTSTTTTTPMATETNEAPVQNQNGFYSFKMTSLDGQEIDFSRFKGKKVLLVNTASACGYTPQYADLQELHEKHGNEVVVLGFPANNFGNQESGSNQEIASFCQKNYGVTFQMFEKISVLGEDRHPLFAWLEENSPNNEKPSWNFSKYLIDENGKVVGFYPSKVKPMGEEILTAIQK